MSKRKNKPIRPPGREKQPSSVEPLEELRELFSRPTEPGPFSGEDHQGLQIEETAATSQLLLAPREEAALEPEEEQPPDNQQADSPTARRLKALKAAKKERRLKTIGQALKEMEQAVSQKLEQSIQEEVDQTEAEAVTDEEELENSLRTEIEQAVDQTLELALERVSEEEGHSKKVKKFPDRPKSLQHTADKRPDNVTKTGKVRGTPRSVAPPFVADLEAKDEEEQVDNTNQLQDEVEAQEQEIYLTIKQVATIVQVELSTIRYWEREFADYLGPSMIRNQRKCFSQDQLEFFTKIKELLKTEQYTIEGAKRRLELDHLLAGSLGVEHNFKNTVFIMFSAIMQELQEARRESRELTIQVARLREEKNLVEEQLQEEQSKGLLDFLKTKLNKKNPSDKEV